MTGLDPEASRLPGTGVCYAGRGTPSAREMTTGQVVPSAKQPDKGAGRDLQYQFRAGLAVSRPSCDGCRQRSETHG